MLRKYAFEIAMTLIALFMLGLILVLGSGKARAQSLPQNAIAVQKLCYGEKQTNKLTCALLKPRPPFGISYIRHMAARLYEVSRHGRGDYATRAGALYEGWAKELGQGIQPRLIGLPNAGVLIETALIRRFEDIAAGKDVLAIGWSPNARKLMSDSLDLLEAADVNHMKDWREMRAFLK